MSPAGTTRSVCGCRENSRTFVIWGGNTNVDVPGNPTPRLPRESARQPPTSRGVGARFAVFQGSSRVGTAHAHTQSRFVCFLKHPSQTPLIQKESKLSQSFQPRSRRDLITGKGKGKKKKKKPKPLLLTETFFTSK